MRFVVLYLLACAVLASPNPVQAPVYAIVREESSIKFYVKASVPLEGTFDKWDATLRFTSGNLSTGSLRIKIQAASVNTANGRSTPWTRVRIRNVAAFASVPKMSVSL